MQFSVAWVLLITFLNSHHEAKFKVGNDTFQGVVTQTNNERIGRNNEVIMDNILDFLF